MPAALRPRIAQKRQAHCKADPLNGIPVLPGEAEAAVDRTINSRAAIRAYNAHLVLKIGLRLMRQRPPVPRRSA
jgi:hypothetical protein